MPELEQALLDRVGEFGSTWLDARGVTFMDSSDLRVLGEAANASKAQGGEVVVLSPPERILRRIRLGGLAGYLSIDASFLTQADGPAGIGRRAAVANLAETPACERTRRTVLPEGTAAAWEMTE